MDDGFRARGRRRLRRALRHGGMPMQPDLSWCSVLEHHARRTPDQVLAAHGDRAVTYREMQEWSAGVAGGLLARGVTAGDVVALLSYNKLEFLTTIFAANHLGAIAMPINWRLAAPELRFILGHSGARALVCDHELVGLADEATKDLDQELTSVCIADDNVPGWERFTDLAAGV